MRRTWLLFSLVIVIAAVLQFQNCAKVNFAQAPEEVISASTEIPTTTTLPLTTTTTTIPPKVICDPFAINPVQGCELTSLLAELYYLDMGNSGYSNVRSYIERGTKASYRIALTKISVPVRSFESGFPIGNGDYLSDSFGNKLIEHFALKIRGTFQLSPNDPPGWYYFGLLSDDGSVMSVQNDNGEWEEIVNNDGTHAPQPACSAKSITFFSNTRKNIEIKYYQGPRTQIALTLFINRSQDGSPPPCDLDESSGWKIPGENSFYKK